MYELQAYRNGIAMACTAVNYRGEVLAQFLLKLDTLLLPHAHGGDLEMVQEQYGLDET